MEQIRAPQAAPEWPSAELGIGEKRSLRKGVTSRPLARWELFLPPRRGGVGALSVRVRRHILVWINEACA